ncbi:MAG: BrnT family toxin [Steroidobacteraceae bacterium]
MTTEFEWDEAKARANLRKHGIPFDEAASAFYDPLSVTIPDPDHSASEARFVLLGVTVTGRLVVVAHTDRSGRIRLISARRPTRRERSRYEKA